MILQNPFSQELEQPFTSNAVCLEWLKKFKIKEELAVYSIHKKKTINENIKWKMVSEKASDRYVVTHTRAHDLLISR